MNLLILTEGGQKNGFGHITRCCALRDALTEQGNTTTFVVNGDASVKKQFGPQIDHFFNWPAPKARLTRLLRRADIAIVDSYQAPLGFYKSMAKTVPVAVYLDDSMRLSYPEGIVVNGGIDAEKCRYSRRPEMRFLLGPAYALLRKDFWKVPPKKVRRKIKDVLITLGGIDRSSFIRKLLTCLLPKFLKYRFHVILSSLKASQFKNPRACFYSGLNAKEMRKLMLKCDAAISGGGQTTNELAACGLPTVGIRFAENQTLNIQGWRRHGFLKYAGPCEDPAIFEKLEIAFSGLSFKCRRAMGEAGRSIIDGAGAARVASEIADACFRFQKVQMQDREQIFEWSNAPEVRSVSFNSHPIPWDGHCQWFKKKLRDPCCFFYKVLWLDHVIGQVRFDRSGRNANMSVVLDKKFRGKGLGGPVIRTAVRHVLGIAPGIRTINAFIKGENTASAKAFLRAGFRLVGTKKNGDLKTFHLRKGSHENAAGR